MRQHIHKLIIIVLAHFLMFWPILIFQLNGILKDSDLFLLTRFFQFQLF